MVVLDVQQKQEHMVVHGEHYVHQQKLDINLLDGIKDQLQLQIHQRQQQISQ